MMIFLVVMMLFMMRLNCCLLVDSIMIVIDLFLFMGRLSFWCSDSSGSRLSRRW